MISPTNRNSRFGTHPPERIRLSPTCGFRRRPREKCFVTIHLHRETDILTDTCAMSTYLPIPQCWGYTKGKNYRHTEVEQTKESPGHYYFEIQLVTGTCICIHSINLFLVWSRIYRRMFAYKPWIDWLVSRFYLEKGFPLYSSWSDTRNSIDGNRGFVALE